MSNVFVTLTDALLTALTDAGLRVGDGETPDGVGWQGTPDSSTFLSYCVLHPMLGGHSTGSIGAPHGDKEILYQVSCYGPDRAAAEVVAGLVEDVMLAARPTMTGHKVRYVDDDALGGARRDDQAQPPLWVAVPRYRFYTTST